MVVLEQAEEMGTRTRCENVSAETGYACCRGLIGDRMREPRGVVLYLNQGWPDYGKLRRYLEETQDNPPVMCLTPMPPETSVGWDGSSRLASPPAITV